MNFKHIRWVAPAAALLILGSLWLAPVSPLAISRADVALGHGDAARAVQIYDQVAQWTPVASVRARALDRAAAVYAGELNDPISARIRLEELLEEAALAPRQRANLQARLGGLLLRERRPARAAKALVAAVQTDPDAREAADRMALAAQAYGEANMPRKARAQWQLLQREHPPWHGRAALGLAEVYLATGEVVQALPRFQEALVHGTADEQSAAQLGVSVCLEKLGDLDQALAAIVDADLPDGVLRSRSYALKARQTWIP